MKKGMLFLLVLIFTTANVFAATYTQRVDITAGTGTQEMEFDYYDGGNNLTNVSVKLYTTVSGGDNAADNDDDDNSVDVKIHLGADFDLKDRYNEFSNPNVQGLLMEVVTISGKMQQRLLGMII